MSEEEIINKNWDLIKSDIFVSRNYNLFGMLADVRTREGIKPISIPRGIPSDASESYKETCKEWNLDGHSHSYLYLSELSKIDWTDISEEMTSLVEDLKIKNKDWDTIRIVFFFDN